MQDLPDHIKAKQIATALNVATSTLTAWRQQGRGPEWVQVEGRIRYPRDKFLEWLEVNTRTAVG